MSEEKKGSSEQEQVSADVTEEQIDDGDAGELSEAFFEAEPGSLKPSGRAPGLEDEPVWGTNNDPVIPPLWQPVLPLFMVLLSGYVMWSFWSDFQYFFSPRTPVKLGNVQEGCQPSFYANLPHNRLVEIKGLFAQPGMTAEARIRWSKQNYAVAMGCNLLMSMSAEKYRQVAMSYFTLRGRLMEANRSGAVGPLRKYYGPSGILSFGKQTYILFADERPNHKWWLLLVYLFLGALFVVNLRLSVGLGWRYWIRRESWDGQ
jgi:hypothetical protein